MRRFIPGIALAIIAASCGFSGSAPARPATGVEIAGPSGPYTEVSEGVVRALVPDHWREAPLPPGMSYREGLMASPNLDRWNREDGSVPGLEVSWVDGARVGIPSDYYYLAANGPAIPHVASSHRCEPSFSQVIVDHRPDFGRGPESPGDFVVRAAGTCRHHGLRSRWAYFVAAPGFGPLSRMGIPGSELYTAFAVLPDGPRADLELHRMLKSAVFGQVTIGDLVLAARQAVAKQ